MWLLDGPIGRQLDQFGRVPLRLKYTDRDEICITLFILISRSDPNYIAPPSSQLLPLLPLLLLLLLLFQIGENQYGLHRVLQLHPPYYPYYQRIL